MIMPCSLSLFIVFSALLEFQIELPYHPPSISLGSFLFTSFSSRPFFFFPPYTLRTYTYRDTVTHIHIHAHISSSQFLFPSSSFLSSRALTSHTRISHNEPISISECFLSLFYDFLLLLYSSTRSLPNGKKKRIWNKIKNFSSFSLLFLFYNINVSKNYFGFDSEE